MKTKGPGKRKPCKFSYMDAEGSFELDPSSPPVANHQTPNLYGDTNITSSEPSFQQLLLSGAEDIIDLTDSDENVPAPPPVGSLMKSVKNGPSSSCFQPQGVYVQLSSSHIQPSHPLIKDVIEKYSCSQTLLESVLRCTQSGPKRRGSKINAIDKHDGLEIVTSQNSQPQAGADKKAHSRSTLPVESTIGTSKHGSKRGSKRSTLHVESTASEAGNNRRKSTRRNHLGPGPSNLEGPSHTGTEAMASAEIPEAMEHTNAQWEDNMKLLRSVVLDLQKKLPDKDGITPEASQAGDVLAGPGVLPSTSAQGVPSDKGLPKKS